MAKPGKKPFQPTKQQRDLVMLLVAAGMSEDGIAAAVGLCRNTIRKYFVDELLNGHARKKAENLARLQKAAKAGNVTAMKFLATQLDVIPERHAKAPEPKPEKLGKKETAEIEAQVAHKGSSWGEILN